MVKKIDYTHLKNRSNLIRYFIGGTITAVFLYATCAVHNKSVEDGKKLSPLEKKAKVIEKFDYNNNHVLDTPLEIYSFSKCIKAENKQVRDYSIDDFLYAYELLNDL